MAGMFEGVDWRDLEEIKCLKHRYMRCVDQKKWDELAECFTEDATARYSGGKYAADGKQAIMEFLRGSMDRETFHSSHRVMQPEIEFQGPDRATGVWALNDIVVDTQWDITIQGAAFYQDEYVKGEDGRWRIQHTGYLRTYEEMFPRKSIEGLRVTASFWATGGRSEIDV